MVGEAQIDVKRSVFPAESDSGCVGLRLAGSYRMGLLVKWGILIGAGVSLLGIFGIQTASFAAVIAAMGLAIGLAFRGTLANFSAGVMLLTFRPFKVNQVISAAGQTGKVDEIGLFSTTIDTPDDRRIIDPSSAVFGATIENVSHHSTRRVDAILCRFQTTTLEVIDNAHLFSGHRVGHA